MSLQLAGRVTVFSIVGCRHCKAAKFSLQEKGIPFAEVAVDQYVDSVRQQLKTSSGSGTLPQIYFNEVHIGGNVELQNAIKDAARWKELLDLVTVNTPPPESPSIPDDSQRLPTESQTTNPGEDFVCEPDEDAKLIGEIKSADIIGDNWKRVCRQKRTFTGSSLISFLLSNKGLDEAAAVAKGQYLLEHHFIQNVGDKALGFENGDNLYRLLEDDDSDALNHGDTSLCQSSTVNNLGEELRKLILNIYNKFLSEDGRRVDYEGIARSEEFKAYQSMTMQLHRVQIEKASREEKLAFFINVYNALVIHANVVKGLPTSLWQRYKFFNNSKYLIGGEPYSLQNIENGVLRANRKGMGMIFRPFSDSDPRLKVALERHEPLIHFALVCGAKSCPPIKTYSADSVMEQLRTAAESFMEGEDVVVEVDKKTISVSKIFSWYKADFGGTNATLVQWIIDNMSDSDKKSSIVELMKGGKYKVAFLPYDWSTNK